MAFPVVGAATPGADFYHYPFQKGSAGLGNIDRGPLLVVAGVDDRRDRRYELVFTESHHDHALRRAAEPLDLLDRHPDDGAARRDQHHLVAVADDPRTGEMAARLGQLHGLDA